jgi:hypothetical protein
MVSTCKCENVRCLEQLVLSEHEDKNSDHWFESSIENSDTPAQQPVGSPRHNLNESCSMTSSTATLDVCNTPKKNKQWTRNAECLVCDRNQNMEPCMEDT